MTEQKVVGCHFGNQPLLADFTPFFGNDFEHRQNGCDKIGIIYRTQNLQTGNTADIIF